MNDSINGNLRSTKAGAEKMARKTQLSYIKRFLSLLKPYRGLFIVVVIIAIIHQAMNLTYPWLARIVMDEVITGKSDYSLPERQRMLWIVGCSIFGLAIGIGVASFARGNLLGKLLWRVIFDLRQQLNWHLQKLSLSFFARQKTGRLVSRLINDINQVSALVSHGAVNLFLDLIVILVIVFILWKISALLTCLSFLMLPVYVFTFRRFNPQIRQASRDVQRHIAVMSGNVQERLSGMSLIQSFTSEEQEHELFTEDNEAYTKKVLQRRNLKLFLKSMTATVTLVSNGIILIIGGYLALSGELTAGDVLAFILYIRQVYAPLGRLAEINIQIQQAFGSIQRVFDILDITPGIKNAPNAIKSISGNGHLRFEHVRFSYEQDRPILQDINLDIQPGQKVAVIGPSGAGKSTLAALVPRLYDVSGGRILIDSVDVRKIDIKTLRRTIGIVEQEPFLFSTTIIENISYGRRNATMAEIVETTKIANVHDFIESLPKGYESLVGERGVNLSVGQKQRICIARTILKNPKILILDEATSSLDSESENLVQEAMERLMKNRTSIIIAHRLSTIMNADFVTVLDQGNIQEQGTHSKLWNKGRLYTRLLEQQFGPLKDLMEKAMNDSDKEEKNSDRIT